MPCWMPARWATKRSCSSGAISSPPWWYWWITNELRSKGIFDISTDSAMMIVVFGFCAWRTPSS